MFWLYLLVIVLTIIGLGIFFYVIFKRLSQPIIIEKIVERPAERFSNSAMEQAIRNGMKSALREMESERKIKEELEKSSKNSNKNMGIYTSYDRSDDPVKHSGGNLVPFNLNEDEKRVLEMFYND